MEFCFHFPRSVESGITLNPGESHELIGVAGRTTSQPGTFTRPGAVVYFNFDGFLHQIEIPVTVTWELKKSA